MAVKSRKSPKPLKPPKLSSPNVVLDLLNLIAGGDDKGLTIDQFQKWRELIMYAVNSMRAYYEHPRMRKKNVMRQYYQPDWKDLDEAKNEWQILFAIEGLRGSIRVR